MTDEHAEQVLHPSHPVTEQILRWCASVSPALWFPSQSVRTGLDRDTMLDSVRMLREAGLIEVADWVKGQGQGYRLTEAGAATLSTPTPPIVLNVKRAGSSILQRLPANRGNYDRAEITRQALTHPRPAIISPAILMACAIWFVVGAWKAHGMGISTLSYIRDGDYRTLLKLGAVHGPEVYAGEWWRLLTACFVHIGAVHLLANLFSLGMIGPLAEGLWGRKRFIVLFTFSGIASTCAALALQPNAVTAGASGAIWGLQTAVLLWIIRFRQYMPDGLFTEWFWRLILVIGVNAAISFAPGVSWEAHLFGGIVGFTTGAFLDWTRRGVGLRQIFAGLIGLVSLAIVISILTVVVTHNTHEWQDIREGKNLNLTTQDTATEFVQRVNSIRPSELHRLQQTAMISLLFRSPNTDTETIRKLRAELRQAENMLADLQKQASSRQLNIPANLQEYLAHTSAFVDQLLLLLIRKSTPTPTEWAELSATFQRADAVWTKLVGKSS